MRAARFEAVCAIEDYDFAYNAKIPTARIRDLATLRFVEAGESVVLHGPVGVGKTMIAQALGHLACRRGYNVAFTKASRLLADLAGGHADRTWEARLRRWARPAVLIVDDFAMRSFTPTQSDDLYELVTERAGKSLITTANRAATDWYSLFPNAVVAESILDRVVNSAHHIHMDGKSYRPNTRPGAPKGKPWARRPISPRCVPLAVAASCCRPRAAGAGAASTAHRVAGASASLATVPSGSKWTTTAPPITGGRPVGCGSSECAGGTPR